MRLWKRRERERPRTREDAIRAIRGHFAFFSHPLDDWTDEEVERCVTEAGRAFARFGVTTEEAGRALMALGGGGEHERETY